MHNPDMQAFTYRIQKIMRDMRYTAMPDEEEELRRDAVIAALGEVCEKIEREFGE